MNKEKEWILEVWRSGMHPQRWDKSMCYGYSPLKGIYALSELVEPWLESDDKESYRLRHKPTGKIIPGELL